MITPTRLAIVVLGLLMGTVYASGSSIQIFVRTPSSKILTLDVQQAEPIVSVMDKIESMEGIEKETQTLMCKSEHNAQFKKRMNKICATVLDYNLQKQDTLQLTIHSSTPLTQDERDTLSRWQESERRQRDKLAVWSRRAELAARLHRERCETGMTRQMQLDAEFAKMQARSDRNDRNRQQLRDGLDAAAERISTGLRKEFRRLVKAYVDAGMDFEEAVQLSRPGRGRRLVPMQLDVPVPMQIFVKVNGRTLTLDVEQNDTITSVMGKLERREGTENRNLDRSTWLSYGGKPLRRSLTLGDYNIQRHATLELF